MSKRRHKRSFLDSDDEEEENEKIVKIETVEGFESSSQLLSNLRCSGLILDGSRNPEIPHKLTCEQAMFKSKLEKNLKSDATTFLDELQQYLDKDNEVLLKALMPVQGLPECSQDPESFIRILLNVECIQATLASFLLEKLAIISLENEGETHGDTSCNIPKLILNSLRWLNVTKNGEVLCEKLIEILDATPDNFQIEIISSLPEIIPDQFHDKVAQELKKGLKKKHLTATILDTFTNLSIKKEMSLHLRNSVLEGIKDAPKEDLPIMVKFIVASTTPTEAIMEIDTLRENLNLDKQSKRKILSQNIKIQNEDFDVLVLDVIRISMTSELKISDAWFTSIDKGALDTLKSLDFLVLLLLYDLPNKRKSVESLVKTKIRNGKITQELVKKCFANHAKILRSEFESLQNIAENLMNSQEKILNYFSMVFHVQAFAHLDRFCQQEIIADLATQIGTNPKTRDIALDTLKELSKNHTELLAKFSFYISGFLDHVINLNLSQVRQIMDILSTLAYNSPHLGQVLRDDLHMVIRKQITANSKSTLKQIGVIGAVAVVKNMCKISSVDAFKSSENGQGSSSGRSNLINQALEVLEMVKRATKTFGSVSGLFMDELACIFDGEHDLHSELLDWISDKMANDFQDEFVVDVSQEEMEGKIVHDFLPFKLLFAIEDPALEDNIGLNLSQIVAKGGNFATKASRLIPHFRLMSKCIGKQQNGHLDDIDAVLGCPIWMVSEEIYDKCESLSTRELSVLCDINFFCLNFFRELINTFSGSSISEDRNKVLIRLKNMLRIEENLEKILPFHSGYVPPIMLHLEDLSAWNSPIVQNETGKGKGNKKKRKAGQDITNCDNNGDDSTIQNEVENCPKIDLAAFAPFFREFDLSVFKILTFNILTIGSQDEDEPKLRPKEFLVLIKDLNMKLSHVLVTTKKGFPGKMKQSYGFSNLDHLEALHIVKFTISLMENILADGEVVAEYFKNILDLYDGNTESQELYKDDHFGDFNACLEQVFQSLVTLMTWNGFENQVELYKKALKNLNRLNKTDKDSLKDLSLKALEYLSKFQGAILKASVADSHLKLMEAANFGNENSNLIHLAGKNYLSRKWFCAGKSAEKGAKFHGYIENFLTSFLNHCQDDFEALKIIEEIVNEGLMSMVENQENQSQFVTLNKNTLPVYFKAILNSLVSIVSKKRSNEDKLEVWMTSTELFQKMMLDVVKKMASPRAILGPLLKASRPFLDLFLKQGMSMMDKVFNRQRDDCIGLLKSMQLCTRYLQHVCSFSRQKLDVGLAAQVPPLRKLLEQFVYRVKAMLALNNALEAFWLGNLKHRDLQGKELDSSQIVDEDEEEIVDEPDEESENEKENEVEEEESLEY